MKESMKSEWVKYKLSEVCTKITDGSHNPPKGVHNSQYLMLSSKNIYDDLITFENPRYLTEKDHILENKRTNIQIGDVLLTIVGTIGRVAVVPANMDNITFQRSVAVLKVNKNTILPRFLMYTLRNNLDSILSNARGVAQKGIYLNQLKNLDVPIPSLEEQKRIVSILDDVFKDADKALEIYKTNLLKTKNIFESYLDAIFNYESVNWEQSKLGDVAELIRGPFGGSLKKTYFTNSGYAIYEQSHAIHSTYNHFRYFIDTKKYQEMKRFTVYQGDIIMSCSGTMGKTSIIPQDAPTGIINQALLLIRTKKHLLNSFLKLWMESNDFNKKLERLTLGAAIKNVASVKILKNIDLCYPPLEIQKDIVKKAEILLSDCNTLEVNYKNKRKYTELLKKSVLNKAFKGEL